MTINDVRYWRVIGRLRPDNRFTMRAGYLDQRPREEPRYESSVWAEMVDRRGRLLPRHPLRTFSECTLGERTPSLAVRGWVPFPPDCGRIRITHHGIAVHEIEVSASVPAVRLTWVPEALIEGRVRITWEAEHPDGRSMEHFLRCSVDGRRWFRASGRTGETSYELDFDLLPGGDACRVAVVTTDGVNTAITESRHFRVRRQPARAMILSPLDGSAWPVGMLVPLRGQGFWLEEMAPERDALVWSQNGEAIARGAAVDVELEAGEHTIELRVGEGDRSGTALVRLWVGDPIADA